MQKIIVGGKTLDNIALSIYKDAKVIFREYVQNATDAIDDAVKVGSLNEGDGKVIITIDKDARRVTIEDNGAGVSALDFKSKLLDIGNSDKKLNESRGYRGQGRFCGLGYCKTLIFTSTRKGETKLSTMVFDAEKLRAMINDDEKYTAEIILNSVVTFDETTTSVEDHFFRVELIDVTNDGLLDKFAVREYLSFVAPVPYSNQFPPFSERIAAYAAALNCPITEYKIIVNGEPLVKNYKKNFTTKNGTDEIFDVEFHDFCDGEGQLIAWSWIGLSIFKGIIQQTKANPNQMRNIRLRQKNIQIGDETALEKLFGETRGTTYFIGEIHAVDINLKPNSQRDYFADNDALRLFEEKLRDYFKELSALYRYASEVRTAFKAMNEPEIFEQKIKLHTLQYQETHKAEHDAEIERLLDKAIEKEKFINTERQKAKKNPDSIFSRVFEQIAASDLSTFELRDENDFTPPHCHYRLGRKKLQNFTKTFTKSFSPTVSLAAQSF